MDREQLSLSTVPAPGWRQLSTMGFNVKRTSIYLAMACLSIGLAGRGGGGGTSYPLLPSSTQAPPSETQAPSGGTQAAPAGTPASVMLSGTAATGAPIANATVTVRCVNAVPVTVTTTDAGRWSADLSESVAFPCLVTVSGGSLPAGASLHSLAVAAGHVNVTPLTDLVLAKAAQASPSTLESASASADALGALALHLPSAWPASRSPKTLQ